jgi:hypothetical protein
MHAKQNHENPQAAGFRMTALSHVKVANMPKVTSPVSAGITAHRQRIKHVAR